MSQATNSRLRRVFWTVLAGLWLTGLQSGCNVVLLLGYLIGGPPSIEPEFTKQTGQELTKKGTTTLVLCYAPTELKWDNDAIDYELSKALAYRLNQHGIRVVDPDRVRSWLDKNSRWDKPSEVGAEFEVNYVIYVDLKDYSLYEEHSTNLYRGRADAIVSVVHMDGSDGDVIFSKDVVSRYPTRSPVPVDQFPYQAFKKLYLSRLSEEVGRNFYESFAGDDIPHGAL